MVLHRIRHLMLFSIILSLLLISTALSAVLAQEQTSTPTAATEPTGTPTVEAGTPTPTRTPTLTPTATPTLTELQSKLTLAQTYLAGKNYDRAAELFAEIAEEDRGNPEALAGLKAALDGQAMMLATMIAPPPTPQPTPAPPPPPVPTLGQTIGARLRDYLGTTLAALMLVVLVYLLANVIRWALMGLRELWYMKVLPWLNRPAVAPGFLIGEFTNGLGAAGANAAAIVPLAITEKLLAWNQLVQAREVPVEPEPRLDLGGMSWLKVLWSWILPPPRGYKVTGSLMMSDQGLYRLAVQRTALARNVVDRSATFERAGASADAVYRSLAGEAAKWLVSPADMEASQAIAAGMRATKGVGTGTLLSPSEIFDQALALLLPVRQQVSAGAVDYVDARSRLRDAEGLLNQLPEGSGLRRDLETVIADLRKHVPTG
ncbi:MAG: hypothetical protein N2204_04835 [Anaerolineae bacterium]|nr:hypothetical protein [Anaerolineae bacterium]